MTSSTSRSASAALAAVRPDHVGHPLARRRLLLVEDSETARKLYALTFERAGADVLPAANAEDARRVFLEERADGRSFDLAVLDFGLPDSDGATLAGELRGLGFSGAVAGLTAGVGEADARRWRGGGCDAVLPKSLSMPAVVARLAALACRPPRRSVPPSRQAGRDVASTPDERWRHQPPDTP